MEKEKALLEKEVLQLHHGVVWTNRDSFPFSVYPPHYDIPFTPGEAPSITASRVDLSSLPPRLSRYTQERNNLSLKHAINNLSHIVLWEKGMTIGPREKSIIDMVVVKLFQSRELSFFDLVKSIVISRNEGEFQKDLLLLRFILVTLSAFSVIQSTPSSFLSLASLTPSSLFRLSPSLKVSCVLIISCA